MPETRKRWSLLPDTLAWWAFTLVAGAVVLVSGIILVYLLITRNDAGVVAAASQAADQIVGIKRLIERARPEDRYLMVRRLSSATMTVVITHDPIVTRSDNRLASRVVLQHLRDEFAAGTDIRVDSEVDMSAAAGSLADEVASHGTDIEIPEPANPFPPLPLAGPDGRLRPPEGLAQNGPDGRMRPPDGLTLEQRQLRRFTRPPFNGQPLFDAQGVFRVSVKIAENTWLNARELLNVGQAQWRVEPPILVALAALLVSLGALWALSRAFRPLALFAAAAERLGVDVHADPLPETGFGEVRRAAHAFNTMQSRLKRFINDRTQMLAAISHDLRTPITRLRLRAEFVDDEVQRAKMLRDLEEMEEMIAATLAFSRDDAANEPVVGMDLAGLLAGIAADQRSGGGDVSYSGPESLTIMARPMALKRALVNLVDNAVKYGQRCRIALARLPGAVEILVDDDGPGIKEADAERVFAPFVRLEASRSRETGGTGLGLTIARNAVRGMGGDVELRTRAEGGLRARVMLPAAELRALAAE